MIKKIIVIAFLIYVFFPINAFAYGVSNVSYNAGEDTYYIYFDSSQVSSFNVQSTELNYTQSFDYAGTDYFTLTCNSSYTVTFFDSSGSNLGTDNVTTSQITNENAACESSSSDESDENCGCIFNTPGWQDYVDQIDDVIGAIPPPPNWGTVADKFRDSIVPSLIGEQESMLGYAPDLPSEPSYPDQLDEGNLQTPTGQEADGLEDASFGSNDIKSGADKIEEREDPTGGFDILDPVDSLPSQEEFKDNIPEEGEMVAPEVPEVDAEAPEVPDVEGTAPEPPQLENQAPGAPEEQENIAPTPPEPEEGENVAPSPGDVEGEAPQPEEGNNTAPTPTDQAGSFPVPGDSGESFPIPGADETEAPTPTE